MPVRSTSKTWKSSYLCLRVPLKPVVAVVYSDMPTWTSSILYACKIEASNKTAPFETLLPAMKLLLAHSDLCQLSGRGCCHAPA